jgi:hypothetical protein
MYSGHAHVIKVRNLIAHDFRRDQRLFRYRNIAGTGGNDHNASLTVSC